MDSVGFSSNANPPAWFTGDLVDPTPAAWAISGHGGTIPSDYWTDGGQCPRCFGNPTDGFTAKVMIIVGGSEQPIDISTWTVTAELLNISGGKVADLTASTVDANTRSIAIASLGTGVLRAMIVKLSFSKPGTSQVMTYACLLTVAAS